MNTNLGRTECAVLTNKSGGALAQGALVIVDSANALSFTTTTTSGFINGRIGVVLEPNGIANNAVGLVAFSGYVPRINLASAAALGDYVKSHTVAGQGTPHAVPPQSGDFAQVLESGSNPSAVLLGSQVQLSAGGGAYFAPTGLTGATQASRYVGATASGAPISGTFAIGDYIVDQTGKIYICAVAGSPGTWVNTSGTSGIAGITKLEKTAVQSIATGAWRTITWDVEGYDNLGAFNIGASASNITVPTSVILARVTLFSTWGNNSNSTRYIAFKNNSSNYMLLFDIRAAVNEAGGGICGGWIPVTAGHVYHLEVNSGNQTLNFGDGTFPTTYPQITIEWATSYASLHA